MLMVMTAMAIELVSKSPKHYLCRYGDGDDVILLVRGKLENNLMRIGVVIGEDVMEMVRYHMIYHPAMSAQVVGKKTENKKDGTSVYCLIQDYFFFPEKALFTAQP